MKHIRYRVETVSECYSSTGERVEFPNLGDPHPEDDQLILVSMVYDHFAGKGTVDCTYKPVGSGAQPIIVENR